MRRCPRPGWGALTWPRGPGSCAVHRLWFQVGVGLSFLERGVSRVLEVREVGSAWV